MDGGQIIVCAEYYDEGAASPMMYSIMRTLGERGYTTVVDGGVHDKVDIYTDPLPITPEEFTATGRALLKNIHTKIDEHADKLNQADRESICLQPQQCIVYMNHARTSSTMVLTLQVQVQEDNWVRICGSEFATMDVSTSK